MRKLIKVYWIRSDNFKTCFFFFSPFLFLFRICPGKELAEASLFTEMAMILATFEISKGKDEAGNVIEPSLEMRSGVIRCAISGSFK